MYLINLRHGVPAAQDGLAEHGKLLQLFDTLREWGFPLHSRFCGTATEVSNKITKKNINTPSSPPISD